MTEHDANPYQSPHNGVPGEQGRKHPPAVDANKNPWDNEPTWPGPEYDDDEAVADGMSDDDDTDPPSPWLPAVLGFPQRSLWDEAIARIFACKARSDSL